jgi:hypothetical protein
MNWRLLILSLPTDNANARMRAWRALKASGAAVLRDGVYLLPDAEPQRLVLAQVAAELHAEGGVAHVFATEGDADGSDFAPLFDRAADYRALLDELVSSTTTLPAADALKLHRKSHKRFEQVRATDFFPGEAQRQARDTLDALAATWRRALAPDEPQAVQASIVRRDAASHRGRVWATRRRPWVDRLACAWLIRRCIDPDARFLWLADARDCPADALGFDFDGATFSHVGERVSFEVLLASFGLTSPALQRLGELVHALDVGVAEGAPWPPEARGVERVLAGMRDALPDDDALLAVANGVFEALYITFEKDPRA